MDFWLFSTCLLSTGRKQRGKLATNARTVFFVVVFLEDLLYENGVNCINLANRGEN